MENKYKQMWEELEKRIGNIMTADEMIEDYCKEQQWTIGQYHTYTEGQKDIEDKYKNLIKEIKARYFPKPRRIKLQEGIKMMSIKEEDTDYFKGLIGDELIDAINELYEMQIKKILLFKRSENHFDQYDIYYLERSNND